MSEELQKEILERLDKLEAKCDILNSRQFNLEADIRILKGKLKSVSDFNSTDIITQIESKLDHHDNMLDVLAARTTHQEAEIKGLKIAK